MAAQRWMDLPVGETVLTDVGKVLIIRKAEWNIEVDCN